MVIRPHRANLIVCQSCLPQLEFQSTVYAVCARRTFLFVHSFNPCQGTDHNCSHAGVVDECAKVALGPFDRVTGINLCYVYSVCFHFLYL